MPRPKSVQLPLPLETITIDIPLTQGQTTVIDGVDADLAGVKWLAIKSKHGGFYAARHPIGDSQTNLVYLHRIILERVLGRELTRADEVDHIDLNKLNNVRSNLRLATTAQNQHNARLRKDNKSGYKGVIRVEGKKSTRWAANINAHGKHIYLGSFATPEEAHEAYKKAAEELHGEFARME